MSKIYEMAMDYMNKYPWTVAWRIRKHCEVVERHLNPDEEPIYVFAGQKNDSFADIFTTCVVVLTNKRILIGQKRVVWGYFLSSITPDLYNDMEVYEGLIWGKVTIDTIKELVIITNLDKKSLPEIETNISEYMMEAKKQYKTRDDVEDEKV
jgi:hypothetical protein